MGSKHMKTGIADQSAMPAINVKNVYWKVTQGVSDLFRTEALTAVIIS